MRYGKLLKKRHYSKPVSFHVLIRERHISKRLLYLIKSSLLKEWGGELREATRSRSKTKKLKNIQKHKNNKKQRFADYAKPARAMHFIQTFGNLFFWFWDCTFSSESGKCFYGQKSLGMHLRKRNTKTEEHLKRCKNRTLTVLLSENQMQSWSEETLLLLIGSCVTIYQRHRGFNDGLLCWTLAKVALSLESQGFKMFCRKNLDYCTCSSTS